MIFLSLKTLIIPQIKSLWAPPCCELCSTLVEDSPALCDSCRRQLRDLPESRCEICALPFQAFHSAAHRCSECLQDPPRFSKVFSGFVFRGSIQALLKVGKFGKQERIFTLMAKLALPAFREAVAQFDPDLLCPMPISWQRRFSRGFNQSALLTLQLKKMAGLGHPVYGGALRRHSAPQAKRDREARLRAIKNAFVLRDVESLDKKRILLIDDVMTTGATAQAMSLCLKRAGAASVAVFTVARVEKK